jgi:hypothetical protein
MVIAAKAITTLSMSVINQVPAESRRTTLAGESTEPVVQLW